MTTLGACGATIASAPPPPTSGAPLTLEQDGPPGASPSAVPTTAPKAEATSASIAPSSSTSTTSTSTTTTSTLPTTTTLNIADGSAFCAATRDADRISLEIDDLSASDTATQAQIADAFARQAAAAMHAFDVAPPELARATSIMRLVFDEQNQLFLEHNYDRQATFNDPRYEDLMHRSEQPEVVAANEDYAQYLHETCGIG